MNNNFLFAEDEALKLWLSDMTVSDNKSKDRPVGVWFGKPDLELRSQAFPFITIDLIDIREATERSMRGYVHLNYQPDGAPAPIDGHGYNTDYPIPYNLLYQVTTWARDPRHDRQIARQILGQKLGGRMHTLYIPEDNTERSMFLLGSQKRDQEADSEGRRLFSTAHTVQVFAELLPRDIDLVKRVGKIDQTILTVTNISP